MSILLNPIIFNSIGCITRWETQELTWPWITPTPFLLHPPSHITLLPHLRPQVLRKHKLALDQPLWNHTTLLHEAREDPFLFLKRLTLSSPRTSTSVQCKWTCGHRTNSTANMHTENSATLFLGWKSDASVLPLYLYFCMITFVCMSECWLNNFSAFCGKPDKTDWHLRPVGFPKLAFAI